MDRCRTRWRRRSTAPARGPRAEQVVVGAARLGRQRFVIERQRALVASAAGREVAAGEEPARPRCQLVRQAVGSRSRRLDRCSGIARGRRQLPPPRDPFACGIAERRPIDDVPDVFGKPSGDAFAIGEIAKGRARIAERGAVRVLPGDEKRLAVPLESERPSALARHDAEPVGRIERINPGQRGKFESRAAGIGMEGDWPGPDHRVIGHHLRRFQIPFDARVLDELDVAEIREPLAAHRVARRIDPDTNGHARQVFDRVGVLRARQPAHRYAAGIARMDFGVALERGPDPVGRCLSLVVGGKIERLDGRHDLGLERVGNLFPRLGVGSGLAAREQLFDAEAGFRFVGAVALEAVALEGLWCAGRNDRRRWAGRGGLPLGRHQHRHRHQPHQHRYTQPQPLHGPPAPPHTPGRPLQEWMAAVCPLSDRYCQRKDRAATPPWASEARGADPGI